MDRKQLERLVAAAIPRGIADESLLARVRKSKINTHPASRTNLLRIYTRRMKCTRGDPVLLKLTEELVHFLESHPTDELLMIDVDGQDGYYTFLLADHETLEILHWMRMFGAGNTTPK
ncbi:hypothetical protein [Nocardia sp. No.11]|jgi:hypothetical protein|uniref:hypothetical protein n=1 Tax=Nocardia sp. No.11 TaxID=3128861 RepID=UPI00319DC548